MLAARGDRYWVKREGSEALNPTCQCLVPCSLEWKRREHIVGGASLCCARSDQVRGSFGSDCLRLPSMIAAG